MSSLYPLALLFCMTALLYSSVGFGGGSSYTALLVVAGTDYTLIPIISLCCNIIVVAGNVFFALKHKLIDWRAALPLVSISVPLSFVGGALPIAEQFFIILLAGLLFFAGLNMLLGSFGRILPSPMPSRKSSPALAAATGGAIGFVSGIVGIGGGIFLAPVLHILGWAAPRKIAASCSLFILVNSCAGLAGQATKWSAGAPLDALSPYLPLMIAVFLGGVIGRRSSLTFLSEMAVKRLTAMLILGVAIRLSLSAANII